MREIAPRIDPRAHAPSMSADRVHAPADDHEHRDEREPPRFYLYTEDGSWMELGGSYDGAEENFPARAWFMAVESDSEIDFTAKAERGHGRVLAEVWVADDDLVFVSSAVRDYKRSLLATDGAPAPASPASESAAPPTTTEQVTGPRGRTR